MTAAGVTTLPLYTVPADLGASFQLRQPGGSESWQITAETDDRSIRLVIQFILGCTRHHPRRPYLKYDRAYRRRPTVAPPPLPAHWPCVHVQVFRGPQMVASLVDDTATTAQASSRQLDVTIAANRIWTPSAQGAEAGSGPETVQMFTEPRSIGGRTRIELTLAPALPAGAWRVTPGSSLRYDRPEGFHVVGVLRGFHTTAAGLPETFAFVGAGNLLHWIDLQPGHPT